MCLIHVEKIPPSDIKLEQAVIGSMMLDTSAVDKVLEIVTFNDFYAPNHQIIIKSISDLVKKNQPVDLVTVSNSLRNQGYLDYVGGYSYLMDLTESVATTSNVQIYAKMVNECYLRRELIKAHDKGINDAYDMSKSFNDLLSDTEKSILDITQKNLTTGLDHIKDSMIEKYEMYSQIRDGHIVEDIETIKTNIGPIDALVKMKPGNLITIAARPAMGKTAYCLNLASNISLKSGLPVAFFSLEMTKEDLVDRLACSESGVNKARLLSGNMTDQEWEKYTNSTTELMNSKIYVDDFEQTNMNDIKSKLRKLVSDLKIKARENKQDPKSVKLGAVIIDYLQLMDNDVDKKDSNRVQEISKMTRDLKKLARAFNVPVIILSQLSREVEKRANKRPQLSDLRDSGSIEQDSDVVMFIYRDEYYNPESTKTKIAELIIAKHRSGPVGTVELFFDAQLTKFSSLIGKGY